MPAPAESPRRHTLPPRTRLGASASSRASLKLQVLLFTAAVVVLLVAVMAALFHMQAQDALGAQLEQRARTLAHNLADLSRDGVAAGDPNLLDPELLNLRGEEDILGAIIIDRSGKVLASTEQRYRVGEALADDATRTALEVEDVTVFRDPRSGRWEVVAPVRLRDGRALPGGELAVA